MRPDALRTLLKLRRQTVEAARRALADASERQRAAEDELLAGEAAIRSEMERASDPDAGDRAVEAFATWLPQGRRRVADAQGTLDGATTHAAQARTALSLARAALEAVESMETEARTAADAAAMRAEQAVMDEAGQRARRR